MQNQQKPRGQNPTRSSACLRWLRILSIGLLLLPHARLHAEAIYRCGDEYSSSAICADGRSAEIRTHVEPLIGSKDKTSSPAHDLREAEALEKTRLRSESRALQHAPAPMSYTQQNNSTGTAETPVTGVRHGGRQTRRLQSPYFTAKDPNALPKKKGSTKALPPVSN